MKHPCEVRLCRRTVTGCNVCSAPFKVVPVEKWPHLQYVGMGKSHSKPLNHPDSTPFKEIIVEPQRSNTAVKGSYKVQKQTLGEGGFAKVKLARTRTARKRRVAVKIASNKDKEAQREVELLNFLGEHENICCLLDFYVKGPDLHMVFELCSEGDLMDYLLKKDRFEEPLAASCAQAIVAAVGFCHSQNIAHRDIKGQNVLVHHPDDSGVPEFKLTDFGAATYFSKWDQIHSQRIGSSCYVAPEVLREKYFPAKADVWSIGATIYSVLHGEPPFFSQASTEVTFSRVLTEKFELPTSIRKTNSTASQHFLLACMTRRSWKRPALDELAKHPWIRTQYIETKSWPEMEVREAENPETMAEDEIWKVPR